MPEHKLPDIADVDMSPRLRNCLTREGYTNLGEVRDVPDSNLLGFRGLGRKSLHELRDIIWQIEDGEAFYAYHAAERQKHDEALKEMWRKQAVAHRERYA
jgi:DNA-directed RNA polymerase alpha subunit